MTSLRAAQLVYSNVEADHSPTNRRGFQVWLCSDRLREQQREIARRVEDFDWPTPDAAANRITERHQFFRTTAGEFAIARTVPLTERDALRRAGRFHAHVVVVTPTEFEKVGNNPFALFDHVPYQSSPTPIIAAGTWTSGHLPDDDAFPLGLPTSPESGPIEVAKKLLPFVVRWLAGPDDPRCVALPTTPEKALAWLRALFAMLPPALRVKASFDTLSTGQMLGTIPFRFAGGYDAATVRDWSYRKAYRLDPVSGDFTVAPTVAADAGLDRLASTWANDPTIPDADRDGSFRAFLALRDPLATVPKVSPTAIELVQSLPGVDEGSARLTRERLATDLPSAGLQALVLADALAWVGPFGQAMLAKVRDPIPLDTLVGWLRATADSTRLSATTAADLEAWATSHLSEHLNPQTQERLGELIVIARRYGPAGVDGLREMLGDPTWAAFTEPWFADWLLKSSPTAEALIDPVRIESTIDALFVAVPADPRQIDEAEMFWIAATQRFQPPFRDRLRFVIAAYRGDQKTLEDALIHPANKVQFLTWVYDRLMNYGWLAEFRLANVDGGLHPGVVLRPAAGDPIRAATLLEAVASDSWIRRRLIDWQAHSPPPGYAAVDQDDPEIKAVRWAYDNGRWEKLRDAVATLSPAQFGWVASDLLADKTLSHKLATPVDNGFWLGTAVVSNGVYTELFHRSYEALINCIRRNPSRAEQLVHALFHALQTR